MDEWIMHIRINCGDMLHGRLICGTHQEENRGRHVLGQELEHGIRIIRVSYRHITGGDSSKRLGQGGVSRP